MTRPVTIDRGLQVPEQTGRVLDFVNDHRRRVSMFGSR